MRLTLFVALLVASAGTRADDLRTQIKAAEAVARRPPSVPAGAVRNPIVAGEDAHKLPLTPPPRVMPAHPTMSYAEFCRRTAAGERLVATIPDHPFGPNTYHNHNEIAAQKTPPAPEVRAAPTFPAGGADARFGLPARSTLTPSLAAVVDRSHACPWCGSNGYDDKGYTIVRGWNRDGSHSHRCDACGRSFSH